MRCWVTLTALAIASGCAVGPDYQRPETPPADAYKEAAGWKPAEPRAHLDRGDWWTVFGDRELDRLLASVDVSNQSALAAEARFRRAQALVGASRAAFFPTLEADASITRSRSPSGAIGGTTAGSIVTNRSASLVSSWEMDLWGGLRRSLESVEASAQASAADLASARLSLRAELAANYFQLRALDAQKRLFDGTVAALEKSLELTRNRYAAGVAARVDVVQGETQLASTRAQAIDLEVQRAQLDHAIAVLVGKAPAALSVVPASVLADPPRIPPGLPSELLERRPDIAAAERRVVAANAEVGAAKAAWFPSLTLSASYGSRSAAASQWFTAPSRFWSIGPALVQPIFDAGLRRAQSEQAIAAYDATVAEYRQAVLSAFQEVEDNLAALRILEEEARVQEQAVRAARESLELTLNQYKAGTVSYLNVVTVQTTLLTNERAAVGILGRRLVASVGLVKALGGGWSTGAGDTPGPASPSR